MLLRLVLAFAAIAVGPRSARSEGVAQPILAAGSEVSYEVVSSPSPPGRLAAEALASLDGPPSAQGALHQDLRWITAGLGAPRTGSMPLGATDDRGRCRPCETVVGDGRKVRISAIRAQTAFALTEVPEVLEIQARHFDGLSVWINGREVVRRNLSPDVTWEGALPGEPLPASALRGPEWETFIVATTPGLLRSGENRISVESRPSPYRNDVGLDFAIRGAPAGRLVRGPMVQRVGGGRASVVFDSDVPTLASVVYSDASGEERVARSAGGALARHHRVWLDNLPQGETVTYELRVGSHKSPAYLFPTPPGASEPLRFVVYGDMRGGHATHAKLVEAILAESPDLALPTGDLVLRGSDEADWQRFFEVSAQLLAAVPLYPVAGNHDLGRAGDEERRMNEIFDFWPGPDDRPSWGHWYSFDVAGAHFVMLDSNSYEHAEQLEWLERDLAAARQRGVRGIFALAHDGPYSRGIHRGNRYAAEHYVPVLARHGVDYFFAGHDHLYQRGEVGGLRYIVSGGGGASLYPVRCGVPGRPRCTVDDGMQHVVSEHHYVLLTLQGGRLTVCPKRPDGSALERCSTYDIDG